MIWAFLSEWVSQNWWIIQHHVENPASFNKEVSWPVFLGLAPKNSNRREKDPNPTWCICLHTRKVIPICHLLIFLATQSGNDCILSVLWAIFWYDQSNLQIFVPMNKRSTIIYPSKPFHYIHPSSIHDLLMLSAPLVQLNISAEASKCHTAVNKLNAVFLPLDLPMNLLSSRSTLCSCSTSWGSWCPSCKPTPPPRSTKLGEQMLISPLSQPHYRLLD